MFGTGNKSPYYKITIPASKFASSIGYFVYYVNLSDLSDAFIANCRSDGKDIQVFNSSGVSCKREIVGFVKSPKAGQLYFVSSAASTVDNVFYIETGSGTLYANNAATWTDAGFISVHHCEETSGHAVDATGLHTSTEETNITYNQAGEIGKCFLYGAGASASKLIIGDNATIGTGNVSISMLIKLIDWGWNNLTGRIMSAPYFEIMTYNNTGHGFWATSDNGVTYATTPANAVTFGAWQYLTVTRSSEGLINIYSNGALTGAANQPGGTPSVQSFSAAYGVISNSTVGFTNGLIDEARICTRIQPVAEIAAYNTNLQTPGSFYTLQLYQSTTTKISKPWWSWAWRW